NVRNRNSLSAGTQVPDTELPLVTTMEVKSISKTSGAPTARSMATSLVLHGLVLGVLLLIPAQVLLRSAPPNKELDIVFYRPPEIAVRPNAIPVPVARKTNEA